MNAVPSHRLMPDKFDLVLESPRGRRVLLVKCKWAMKFPPEHAAYFRQALSEMWDFDAPFFMLAFTGGLYLWKQETATGALPDFMASPESIWRAYVGTLPPGPNGIRAEGVEMAVRFWLSDLAWGIRKLDMHSDADQMLVSSGLYEQMPNADVRAGADA
jgi:hypothetical protein